jgi:hypothetical protein
MTTIPALDHIEVPRPLAQDQINLYLEDGYLVIPEVLTPGEIGELKREIVEIAKGKYPSDNFQPLATDISDDDAVSNILAIHHPHLISPVIVKYAQHPEICGMLGQIVAAHLPFWDGSVKCMQTMLFVKPPSFQGQAWHQDELYIQTRDRSLTGVWIAIDDATLENGCVQVIPGSHRSGYLWPQRDHDEPEKYDVGPKSYGFDESLALPVEVDSGSVIFFNGYLLHASQRNRSAGYRRAMVNHYMNAWSILPWSNPDLPVPSTGDRRAIIPVAGIDPYAWKGIAEHHRKPYLRRCAANTNAIATQVSIDETKKHEHNRLVDGIEPL